MVTKFKGERGKLKNMVDMMTRENTALRERREDLLKEGGFNRTNIVRLRFRMEEAETI